MILNMLAGSPSIKIDLTKCLFSEYATKNATNNGSWGSWRDLNIQDINTNNYMCNDGDNGKYYIGTMWNAAETHVYHWAARLTIVIPNSPYITDNLILEMEMLVNRRPNKIRALLTTYESTRGDPSQLSSQTILAWSYLYSDAECTTRTATGNLTEGSKGYFKLTYNFVPGAVYYIYLYPYANDVPANGPSSDLTSCDFDAANASTFSTRIGWNNYNSQTKCYMI